MILPTKKLPPENSLVYLGAAVLPLLTEPQTVSKVWEDFQRNRRASLQIEACDVSFDWFVLALDLLQLVGAIDFHDGRLVRIT